jgi:non-canonical purine NTP pyrophosphatase (RdgB/HAM1 family)
MKPAFTFVTSNEHKVATATAMCREYGIKFERRNIDLVEIQADDGESIAIGKVRQAFEEFKRPVVITDDNWFITGLNGFPGPYMKYVNKWFRPEDFIRLTKDLEDRRIVMRQIIAYKDSDCEEIFSEDIEGTLLKEVRGESKIPHFTVISFDGGRSSVAEAELKSQTTAVAEKANAWHKLCDWLQSRD